MEKKFKLGVIGAGFMSSSIIGGVLRSGFLTAEQILVSDVNEASLAKLSQNKVNTTIDNNLVVKSCEYVLFAVKPQSFEAVVSSLDDVNCEKYISIMAGVKKDRIKSALSNKKQPVKVARSMPNTPCSIGKGAVGLDLTDFESEADREFIQGLFNSFSRVSIVAEDKLNAVTGVSGSAPAYFYAFIKGIVDAGVKHGLAYEEALNLAVGTMIGSGEMILNNPDKSLEELITAVCSKGGTTIEAIKTFNEAGLDKIIEKAIDACVKRSTELENL